MHDVTKPQMSSTPSINLRDLNPMSQEQAAELVSRLLKGFPYLSLARPKDYSTALIEVLVRYPLWCGQFALRRVRPERDQDTQFLPSDLTLRKWCEEIIQPARDLRHWESETTKALPVPLTRTLPPPKDDPSPEERAQMAFALEQRARRLPGNAAGGHMNRVLADIEARKKAKEEANG